MSTVRSGEVTALERLIRHLPSAPCDETWIGDDAAVLDVADVSRLFFSTDAIVEKVHFDRRWCSLHDIGWKALAVNVSDIAAMGGSPLAAVIAVAGASADEIDALYRGIAIASQRFVCPIVGGDLSSAATLSIVVSVIGAASGEPVLRSGALPGDSVFVTGPLGSSAAGLRLLQSDPHAVGPVVDAHRRPQPRIAEGRAANQAGATAMIDLSDGIGIDLDRLCAASAVGVELTELPVADGATLTEALGGGEDYELLFTATDGDRVRASFAQSGLKAPLQVGSIVADASARRLAGAPLPTAGFSHALG